MPAADMCFKKELALNGSVRRLDEVSPSLSPEDGIGSIIEVVEQVVSSRTPPTLLEETPP